MNGSFSDLTRAKKEKKVKEATATADINDATPPPINTKQESFNLYKQNKSIEEIAKLRNMTMQTIEGHLAYYIQQGLIPVDELVSREKLVLIEPVLDSYDGKSLKPLKDQLGNEVSYGEIRLAVAWREFQKSKEASEKV